VGVVQILQLPVLIWHTPAAVAEDLEMAVTAVAVRADTPVTPVIGMGLTDHLGRAIRVAPL
jgi:hypothetical protein